MLEKCFAAHGMTYPRVFYFPTIGTYAPMLEQAGFRVEYASLFDRPTVQEGRDGLADWISMFVKTPFLGMDDSLKKEIIWETIRETAGYTLAGGSLVRRLCTDTVSSSTGEIVMVLSVIHIVRIKRTEKEKGEWRSNIFLRMSMEPLESAALESRWRKTDWRFGNMLKRAEVSVYAQDVHRTV